MIVQVKVYADDLMYLGIWKGRRFTVKEIRIREHAPRKSPSSVKEYICFDKRSSSGTVCLYYNEVKIIKQ